MTSRGEKNPKTRHVAEHNLACEVLRDDVIRIHAETGNVDATDLHAHTR